MEYDDDSARITRREVLGTMGVLGGAAFLTLHKGDVAMNVNWDEVNHRLERAVTTVKPSR